MGRNREGGLRQSRIVQPATDATPRRMISTSGSSGIGNTWAGTRKRSYNAAPIQFSINYIAKTDLGHLRRRIK
jgi:hypothetical protein